MRCTNLGCSFLVQPPRRASSWIENIAPFPGKLNGGSSCAPYDSSFLHDPSPTNWQKSSLKCTLDKNLTTKSLRAFARPTRRMDPESLLPKAGRPAPRGLSAYLLWPPLSSQLSSASRGVLTWTRVSTLRAAEVLVPESQPLF